jgi:arabinose-5-phosphate isomerase
MSTSAAEVLRAESAALAEAAERVDEAQYSAAARVLLDARRVHVVGSGKSGIIGRKLAATLTSTGTPADFLHPADALHGDIGAVSPGDAVVALSNSGETEEVLALLPYLAARGVPVVAVVGNGSSTLARRGAAVLDARADVECCPLQLAPTTSTTVALAVCDALAIQVMQAKGITAEAFASNHPSGRLGRRLTLTVSDLMLEAPVVPVEPDDGLFDVVAAIGKGGAGAAPVVEDRVLVGIITDGDVRRALNRSDVDSLPALRARDLMTSSPVTTTGETLAYDALRLMEDRPSQIGVLPVVSSNGTPTGLLRLHDLVRAGL